MVSTIFSAIKWQRTKVFSGKAQAWGIASEPQRLRNRCFFTQSSPWSVQHFPSEEIRRWEKSSTYHIPIIAIIKCFCTWKNMRTAWSFLPGKRWSLNVHRASVLYCCLPSHQPFLKGWSCYSFLIQQSLSSRVSWQGYATNIWGHWRHVDCLHELATFTLHAVSICKNEKFTQEQ